MSLQQSLENRKKLEQLGKLPHDTRFDDRVRRESHTCLLLIAALTAAVYAIGASYYYKTKAHEGRILAKSEMTNQEIKSLNLAKLPTEKAHGR